MTTNNGAPRPTYVPCPAPGIMHAGAHITHIPAHMRGNELLTYDAMRAAGVMCPMCQGGGMVAVPAPPVNGTHAPDDRAVTEWKIGGAL